MLKRWTFFLVFVMLMTGNAACSTQGSSGTLPSLHIESRRMGQTLALEQVYDGFDCGGKNVSPDVKWGKAPKNTKSYAVTMFDPDAPHGGWWHWLLFDIPVSVTSLPAGAGDPSDARFPRGAVTSKNDFGDLGYGGACPPKGDKAHRYILTVYALDVPTLGLKKDATPRQVKEAIDSHAVAKISLTSRYARK